MTNEEHQREFIELVVEYPNPDLCTYPEYRGKPYFSIKYRENGKYIVGFGSYKIEMISQWIKEYFMPSVQLKSVECEDCISRAEAIKALEYNLSIEADGGLDKYRTVIKDLLNAIYNTQKKAIEDLPSVQPKAKVGHWQNNACSNCGIYNASAYKNWCPNCGAKMLATDLQFGDQETLMSAT